MLTYTVKIPIGANMENIGKWLATNVKADHYLPSGYAGWEKESSEHTDVFVAHYSTVYLMDHGSGSVKFKREADAAMFILYWT